MRKDRISPWGQDRPEAGSGQRAIALAIGIVAIGYSGVLILALICHLDCLLVAAVDCRVRSTESYQPRYIDTAPASLLSQVFSL